MDHQNLCVGDWGIPLKMQEDLVVQLPSKKKIIIRYACVILLCHIVPIDPLI